MHSDYNKTTNKEKVITKALMNAAKFLEIKNSELYQIIGISEPRLSKISNQQTYIKENNKKEFELALHFIRMYRSLDAIMAGDHTVSAKWLRNYNNALQAVPVDLIKRIDGLIDVVSYLDSRRAKV